MKTKRWLANGALMTAMGAIAFMPAASQARSGQSSAPAQSAGGSSTTVLQPETRKQLDHVWRDAEQVASRTDSLKNFANAPNNGRTMQQDQLKQIQAEVGDMGQRLSRVENMKQSLPPADQRAIGDAMSMVQTMAANVSDAIGDFSASIQYGGYADILNQEAGIVKQDINIGEQTAFDARNLGMLLVFGK